MKTCLSILAALLLLPPAASGQGVLRGVVTDSSTGEALIGANVIIVGTARGSVTDRDGRFLVTHIPAGPQTARFSYLGYRTEERVVVMADGDTTLSVALTPFAIITEGVVVTAQARGQMEAINQQLTSSTIVNVVSEEKIQELPDANAAEAIGRLPGVSIIRSGGEANKVILRGMSDKFTSITVDGVRIAATDANERGVDLSTISQGSLAGIELRKALTSDQDAEAIAGSVNLVTRKAPADRLLRFESKGSYGRMNKTFGQYDFSLKYGERFLDGLLGVQLGANLESRDRSNEVARTFYYVDPTLANFHINDFQLEYTDEDRGRNGVSTLLDVNTPDSGSIRFNTVYNRTDREYVVYRRSYGIDNRYPVYSARDVEQDIRTFSSSLHGENHLFGLDAEWGLSFAQSTSENPYDFELLFQEPSSASAQSGMQAGYPLLTDSPERLIPYAWNNFQIAFLDTGYFRFEKNLDKQRTASLGLSREYVLADLVSGELKAGGKYRVRSRFREASTMGAPYWLQAWSPTQRLADGSMVPKDLQGTRFEGLLSQQDRIVPFFYFLDDPPVNRDVFDRYALYPLINQDALRLWYELNKAGASGATDEYEHSMEDDGDYYDITERVAAAYVMHTLNVGQWATLITGLRVEAEDDDYGARYSPTFLMQFPNSSGVLKDTTAHFKETVWLPNVQATLRLTEFMNLRMAAFRALARPDFNARLDKFVAVSSNQSTMTVGNSQLRAAKAWNYEVNTSFFGSSIGLVSLSVFYKDIKDMVHIFNRIPTEGDRLLDSLGISWRSPFLQNQSYYLTFPYNSAQPTKVWGFEFEHQTNFGLLPGFLRNLVLSYNFSIVRSETYQVFTSTRRDSVLIHDPEFGDYWQKFDVRSIFDDKTRLENQPEFFANVALGYDVGGFSGRISVYHQGDYNQTFTSATASAAGPGGGGDRVIKSYTRLDLSLKQKFTDNISMLLNLNNLTNTEESASDDYGGAGWILPRTSQKYGFTGDLGVRIEW